MIPYPYPTPPSIEVTLKSLPAAFSRLPYNERQFEEAVVVQTWCNGRCKREDPVEVYSSVPFRLRSRDFASCRKLRFRLVQTFITRQGKRFVRSRWLPYTMVNTLVSVSTGTPQVGTWLKNGRVAVSRFSGRAKRNFSSRLARPNPEVVTLTVPHFQQRAATVTSNTVDSYTAFSRTWSGSRTPGFGSLKRRFLPVNNHSVDMHTSVDNGYLQVLVDPINPENSQIFLSGWQAQSGAATVSAPVPSHLGAVVNIALDRLVSRMGQTLDANLAQDMAQFGQLTSLITSNVTRITKTITFLKKKQFSNAITALWHGSSRSPRYRTSSGPSFSGSLANNILELQYGWKPLLQDIHGSMNSLAQFYQLGEHVTRSASASATKELITLIPIYDDAVHNTQVGYAENRITSRVRVQLRYRIDSRLKAFLAQTGFTNPINLAWEVLPYSFILDWALPIGDWLQSISNYDGLEFIDGCQTKFTKQLFTGIINFNGTYAPYPSWQVIHSYGGYRRTRVILDRVKLTSFPRPDFPVFKNPISTEHAVNALALLRGAFGR